MSDINPAAGGYNPQYPIPGINQSSQGFRNNFSSIQQNFALAASEITRLQAKQVILSGDASGSSTIGSDASPMTLAVSLNDDLTLRGNGGIRLPIGGTADRLAESGRLRYNDETGSLEVYAGGWLSFGQADTYLRKSGGVMTGGLEAPTMTTDAISGPAGTLTLTGARMALTGQSGVTVGPSVKVGSGSLTSNPLDDEKLEARFTGYGRVFEYRIDRALTASDFLTNGGWVSVIRILGGGIGGGGLIIHATATGIASGSPHGYTVTQTIHGGWLIDSGLSFHTSPMTVAEHKYQTASVTAAMAWRVVSVGNDVFLQTRLETLVGGTAYLDGWLSGMVMITFGPTGVAGVEVL